LPRRTVSLEEIDEVVSRHYRIDPGLLSAHGRRVGCAKSVAVELAAQLADLSGRAVGKHYGICANAVVANRRRLAARPEVLQAIENLSQKLRKRRSK
jgi:chromosomal replication initiation ATPase DnaA